MGLTEKDKAFLELLRDLMDSRDLSVELRIGRPSYMVLRGTYGEKIHKTFRMTRQGVRWRFQRLFSHVYVDAFSTILFIEKTFGTQLRDYAIRISRERYEARRAIVQDGLRTEANASLRKASSMGRVRKKAEDNPEISEM